jgi:hypothetical protein
MSLSVSFRHSARAEFIEAAAWYESERQNHYTVGKGYEKGRLEPSEVELRRQYKAGMAVPVLTQYR